MIITKTEKDAELVKKSFEHLGLTPVIVIVDDLHLVCRSYEESMRVISLL